MKKFCFLVLCAVMLCGCQRTGIDKEAEATAEPNSGYKFTYYSKDNPEVKYDVDDCVKLGKYKGINIETDSKKKITSDDINNFIISNFQSKTTERKLKRKTIKDDDILRVTRDGKSELFDVSQSGKANTKILVNSKVGDTVTITNTKDKSKTYTFKIDSVVEQYTIKGMSELDDNFIKENSTFDSLAEFKSYAKRYLEADSLNTLSQECIRKVIKNSEVTIPDGLIDYYTMQTMSDLDYYAYSHDISTLDTLVSSYYGLTVSEYEKNVRITNEEYVKQLLVCEAINKAENIEFDENLYQEFLQFMSDMEGTDIKDSDDSLKSQFTNVYAPIRFIMDNAKIKYKE